MGDTSGPDLATPPPTADVARAATGRPGARTSADRPPPVDLRDPVEADLAYRISMAWRELRRGAATAALRDYFFGTGPGALEPGQMDTLDILLTQDHWRMSELADALHVDRSTATRAVQRLVNEGLAVRSHADGDKRVVLVQATPEGWRRHRAVARRRIAVLSQLLAAFDAEERHQLAVLLGRFVDELDALVGDLALGLGDRPPSERSAAPEAVER